MERQRAFQRKTVRRPSVHWLITNPEDLARPADVFPLRALPGGTLERRGHTEASVDLMRFAGLIPGAVICEVLNSTGEAARGESLYDLAQQWNIGIITVDSIVKYRQKHLVTRVAETQLPLPEAQFKALAYQEINGQHQYIALTLGELNNAQTEAPLLRLHSACATGRYLRLTALRLSGATPHLAPRHRRRRAWHPLSVPTARGTRYWTRRQVAKLMHCRIKVSTPSKPTEKLGYPIHARDYSIAIEILERP